MDRKIRRTGVGLTARTPSFTQRIPASFSHRNTAAMVSLFRSHTQYAPFTLRFSSKVSLKSRQSHLLTINGLACSMAVVVSACGATPPSGPIPLPATPAEVEPEPLEEEPTAVVPINPHRTLAAAHHSTCALRDGDVYCWGDRNTALLRVGGVTDAVEVDISRGQGCALSSVGTVSCWNMGALGFAETVNELPRSVRIAVGRDHACALTEIGRVYCWGQNQDGQLGAHHPEKVLPRQFPPAPVVGLPIAVSLAARGNSTCAIAETGEVACWGRNSSGQLGNHLQQGIRSAHVPIPVPGLSGVTQVVLTNESGCAVQQGGNVVCWEGHSDSLILPARALQNVRSLAGRVRGQVNLQSTGPACIVSHDGVVSCLQSPTGPCLQGRCQPGRLRDVPGLPTAVEVAVGVQHACARTTSGHVWCWGRGDHGQLGPGTVPRPFEVAHISELPAVEQTVSGDDYVCARHGTGEVVCWGRRFSCYERDDAAFGVPLEGMGPAEALYAHETTICARRTTGSVACVDLASVPEAPGPCDPLRSLTREVSGLQGARALALVRGGYLGLTRSGDILWVANPRQQTRGAEAEVPEAPIRIARMPGATDMVGVFDYEQRGVCVRSRSGNLRCFEWSHIPAPDLRPITLPNVRRTANLEQTSGQTFVIDRAGQLQHISYQRPPPSATRRPSSGAGSSARPGREITVTTLPNHTDVRAMAYHGRSRGSCYLTRKREVRCLATPYAVQNGWLPSGTTASHAAQHFVTVPGLDDIVNVSGSPHHLCATDTSGSVYCWGQNAFDTLGGRPSTGDAPARPVSGFGLGIVEVEEPAGTVAEEEPLDGGRP